MRNELNEMTIDRMVLFKKILLKLPLEFVSFVALGPNPIRILYVEFGLRATHRIRAEYFS